jgi:hypothetical protein
MPDVIDTRAHIPAGEVNAARSLFAGKLSDCPFCGGFSKPDPRYAPTWSAPLIATADDDTLWAVRCWGCMALVTSEHSVLDVVERWNRRAGAVHAEQQLLPLVDLQAIARRAGVELTGELEVFARHVQADVLRLNRRPTC